MNVVNGVDMQAGDGTEREPTWDEAVAAFEAAEPVELVRSPRTLVVTYRYVDGSFVATAHDLPGFEATGASLYEARQHSQEALAAYLHPAVEIVERYPRPSMETETSGASSGSIVTDPLNVIFEPSSRGGGPAFVSSRAEVRR